MRKKKEKNLMHKSVIKIMRVSIASQNAQYTYVREKDREEKRSLTSTMRFYFKTTFKFVHTINLDEIALRANRYARKIFRTSFCKGIRLRWSVCMVGMSIRVKF